MKRASALCAVAVLAATAAIAANTAAISGQYLEVRSCDVYTGPCFANGEMGQTGKEAILTWQVSEGAWDGVDVEGLNVVAVLRTDNTLMDIEYFPRKAKAAVIVDERANAEQQEALVAFAKKQTAGLVDEVVAVQTAPIEVSIGQCSNAGCGSVKAGDLVEVNTRCLGGEDHLCGNERPYYPPLTQVDGAYPAYTEIASYDGDALGVTFNNIGQRSAFLATFSL